MSDDRTETSPPFLRIVRGDPSPEEIAALVAVLSAASGNRKTAAPAPAYGWSATSRLLRSSPSPGPGGWRASAFTR
ncbi:MAG: acyl-CoA carboxylase subunit epsilon [Actinomycetota bacterium]|nr:acyl-CoA carboxylase subunit epsilon [Actinomycetota bacterium]MDQ3735718.1 acyl-CoA carboxylase subunit epsilon [Actinomycetota bacterium]